MTALPATWQRIVVMANRFFLDQRFDGVMIWGLGQDAKGDRSVLHMIHREAKANP